MCVGWAVTYLKAFQERQERKWDTWSREHTFSPAYVYNQLNRTQDCFGGTYIADALNLLRRDGAATRSIFPYNPESCSKLPDAAIKQAARPFAIADWRRVNAQDETELKNHIASGFPVVIGMRVDEAFSRLGPVIYRATGGERLGGHAMVIIGYDDSRSSFKVINSWGKSWGNGGYGWIDYSVLKSTIREAYVVQNVVTSPAPTPVPPVTTNKDTRLHTYKIDVFWCDESGTPALNQANSIRDSLEATFEIARLRVRKLVFGEGPWASGYEIRVDPDGSEDTTGKLLQQHLAKRFASYGFTGWFSGGVTPGYLSIFVCPGAQSTEELDSRERLF